MRQITLNIPDSSFPFFMELVNKLGFEISKKKKDNDPYKLSNEQEKAIDQALDSVKENGGIPHKQVMAETRKRYPHLFKNK